MHSNTLYTVMAKPVVSHSGYGKNDVRLMRIRRDGDRHYVTELSVCTELQLSTVMDYERGDNGNVVATDSQKNTVLVLAKQNEVCVWVVCVCVYVGGWWWCVCVCILFNNTGSKIQLN